MIRTLYGQHPLRALGADQAIVAMPLALDLDLSDQGADVGLDHAALGQPADLDVIENHGVVTP